MQGTPRGVELETNTPIETPRGAHLDPKVAQFPQVSVGNFWEPENPPKGPGGMALTQGMSQATPPGAEIGMGPSIVVQSIGSQVLGCPKDAQSAPSGLAFPTEIPNIMQVPPSPALVGPELPSLPCLMFETVQMTPPGGHDGLKRTEIVQDPPSWPHVEQEGAQGPPVMPHVGREMVQVPPGWPHAGQKNAQSSPFEVQLATKNAEIVQVILSKTPLEHKNTSENVVPPRGGENSFLGTDAMSEMPRLLPLSSGETP